MNASGDRTSIYVVQPTHYREITQGCVLYSYGFMCMNNECMCSMEEQAFPFN